MQTGWIYVPMAGLVLCLLLGCERKAPPVVQYPRIETPSPMEKFVKKYQEDTQRQIQEDQQRRERYLQAEQQREIELQAELRKIKEDFQRMEQNFIQREILWDLQDIKRNQRQQENQRILDGKY